MAWNWELPDWPKFYYDPAQIVDLERQFLLKSGSAAAYLKTLDKQEVIQFIVEILSTEGVESSKIEGELLNRESLQSSIQRHFGMNIPLKKGNDKEARMAQLLCSVYGSFDKPLTHDMLYEWHAILFSDSPHISDWGKYRTHKEPMQIVSNRYGSSKIFFEAPPSKHIFHEMSLFIEWFNSTSSSESLLGKAAIAHIYFESIHPFEDGNGRIGRVLSEKILSQGVAQPVLIALSKTLESKRKDYYAALEQYNRTLCVQNWVNFFSRAILQAHTESMNLLYFLIAKCKMLTLLSGQLNERQLKALLRMFAEGPGGFQGGLSAANYIAITKAAKATATRDLADLVAKGALIRTGEIRHTRYWLNLHTE